MAFTLVRYCHRRPLKCLKYATETNLRSHNIILGQCCQVTPRNMQYSVFLRTGSKSINNELSKFIFEGGCQRNFSLNSTVSTTGCPLRSVLTTDLLCGKKMLQKLYSTASNENEQPQLSNKDKLKRAVKEYGATVIIFHVTISLISLGCCYLIVTSGISLGDFFNKNGLGDSGEVATEAGLFVVAYAIHKALAPIRIGITLAATPIIVRYLRRINVLKPPKPS